MMAKTEYNKDNLTTPLELLNLYLTAGKSRGDSTNKLYRKFNNNLSWDAILNKGYQTDLAPLLYYIIKKNNQNSEEICISNEARASLEKLYHHHLAIFLMQFNDLDNILETFRKEGIDVIPLKGAELATNYYPQQRTRPMADIDLLVRKNDMPRAKATLIQARYKFKQPTPLIDEDFYEKYHFHFPFSKATPIGPIVVELHQDIASRNCLINNNIQEFWENTVISMNGDRRTIGLRKEYLLLHIFWHTYLNLSKHLHQSRFIWITDIAFILAQNSKIDWGLLLQKAIEWGIQGKVYLCLHLIKQLFDIDNIGTLTSFEPSFLSRKVFDRILLSGNTNIGKWKKQTALANILVNLVSLNTIKECSTFILHYNVERKLQKFHLQSATQGG